MFGVRIMFGVSVEIICQPSILVLASKVLRRIHALMEHSHNRDAVGLFHVVQDMVFIGKAEQPFRNGFPFEA